MEEISLATDKNIESTGKESSNAPDLLKITGDCFQKVFKKVVVFICYGPGVLGFLWLIGRILKR